MLAGLVVSTRAPLGGEGMCFLLIAGAEVPKIKDIPAKMSIFMQNLITGDLRSIKASLHKYLLYKLDKRLRRNGIARYAIWKYHNAKKYDKIDAIPEIRFMIVYFFDGKMNKSAYAKVLRCLNNQTYQNYDLFTAGSDMSQLAAKLDKRKYSFICLIEQNDLIARHALSSMVKVIQDDSSVQLIYSDEDIINKLGIRVNPYFKPQYAPLLLLSHNYLNAFLCLKLTDQVIQEINTMERVDHPSVYKLVLRVMRRGARSARIADVLYHRHWKNGNKLENVSTKNIIQDEIDTRHLNAKILDYKIEGLNILKFYPQGSPKISIIIPFKDKVSLLASCIKSIEEKSTYSNYEIILIDNRSKEKETVEYLRASRHRIITADIDFNYSKLNNMGARIAIGEYLILLNNDIEVITPDWMENLLGLAQLPEVGAVGAKLLFPNNTIQHAGMVKGAIHINRSLCAHEGGYKQYNNLIREYGCVTGACLMLSKAKYCEVKGLTECLAVEGNDVDLCFKLLKAGYYNVCNPHCILYHHESASRGSEFQYSARKERTYLLKNWDKFITNDQFYNPNFSGKKYGFCVKIDYTANYSGGLD